MAVNGDWKSYFLNLVVAILMSIGGGWLGFIQAQIMDKTKIDTSQDVEIAKHQEIVKSIDQRLAKVEKIDKKLDDITLLIYMINR